ncbi:hypothetical protein HPB48_013225 [Haemaphysalis longicornis]|uniref:Uncharacterized protein n=1 Tax=Haemaphysalis longicornis TaxID=44386 RepID=A0A9J6GWW4_HAELO|nr:hypothetical protein HPB48_013225 [Haemaphysalis longicornis]
MKWQTSSVHLGRCSASAAQAESESVCLRHLLTHEELEDRRPSEQLNTMRQLVGVSTVESNGALVNELFLQRLPQSTRIVLAAAGDLTLDRAAELADRVHDAISPKSPPWLRQQNYRPFPA